MEKLISKFVVLFSKWNFVVRFERNSRRMNSSKTKSLISSLKLYRLCDSFYEPSHLVNFKCSLRVYHFMFIEILPKKFIVTFLTEIEVTAQRRFH